MVESYQKKHRVKTEFNLATGKPLRINWYNEFEEEDAPGDLPSEMRFNENGVLLYAFWKRDGKLSRSGDLPTRIYCDATTGKPYIFCWDKDGIEHRDGDRPSTIEFYRESGTLKELRFSRNGVLSRSNRQNAYLIFDEDGTARDIREHPVEFEGFDDRWLPDATIPKLF